MIIFISICLIFANIIKQNTMKELLDQIAAQMETFNTESSAHAEGNKAAGGRARKATLELTKLFKDYRKVSIEESKK